MIVATVAACATAGSNFNEANITKLQPGGTTLEEATQILGARPSQTVWHDNKRVTHIWKFIRASPVGVSENKMVTLIFDANGKLLRVGQLVNVTLNEEDRQRLGVMGAATLK